MHKIKDRAVANLKYSQERDLILEEDNAILSRLITLYGLETADIFARHYRLVCYDSPEWYDLYSERAGVPQDESNHYLAIQDAIEVGRAATEEIHSIKHASYPWISKRGLPKNGYRRKGNRYQLVVEQRQPFIESAQAIKSQSGNEVFTNRLQEKLIPDILQLILFGLQKKEAAKRVASRTGVSAYNLLNALDSYTDSVTEGEEILVNHMRHSNAQEAASAISQNQDDLGTILDIGLDLIYDTFLEGVQIDEVPLRVDIPQWTLWDLRRLILKCTVQDDFKYWPNRAEINRNTNLRSYAERMLSNIDYERATSSIRKLLQVMSESFYLDHIDYENISARFSFNVTFKELRSLRVLVEEMYAQKFEVS